MRCRASTRDLVRWGETLAAIARTGLAFTKNLLRQERYEEVLNVAGDIRAAAASALAREGPSRSGARGRRASSLEWMRDVRQGVEGYVTPKVAIGAIVGNAEQRDPARAAGRLGRLALPDRLGRRRLLGGRGRGEGGPRGDGDRRPSPCGSSWCSTASGSVSPRCPLYSLVFQLRTARRQLEGTPARVRGRRMVRRGRRCPPRSPMTATGCAHAFAAIRGDAVETCLRLAPRPDLAAGRRGGASRLSRHGLRPARACSVHSAHEGRRCPRRACLRRSPTSSSRSWHA